MLPSCITFVRCRFGFQRLLVLLCAWLTLKPTIGFFPHILQTLANGVTSKSIFTFHNALCYTLPTNQTGKTNIIRLNIQAKSDSGGPQRIPHP